MDYKIRDIKLAGQGAKQLEWAEMHMPSLMQVRHALSKSKPFKGMRIAVALHITKETGVLVRTLKVAGAEVYLTAANPLSSQDDVVAALAKEGVSVFARKGESLSEYAENVDRVLRSKPDIVMDDGSDLHVRIHEKDMRFNVLGGTEETTTGINRVKALEDEKILKYPIIAVNNAHTKYLFDNRYGTGQSTVDGVIRATNIFIAGKVAVIAGYGWVGRGVAMRMHGMGARVMVTEVDPFKALEATMDGFQVMKMSEAAKQGDIFVTATGDKDVITKKHMLKLKDGAILSNTGHFDVEINVNDLKSLSKGSRLIREHLREFTLRNGRRVYLLTEGRVVNLGAAEGHPSEVMDLSFCNQVLSALYVAKNSGKLENKVYLIPREIDEWIARIKLRSMNVGIDELTKEQKRYLTQWRYGT